MSYFHDHLETRSTDQRAADIARDLPVIIAKAKANIAHYKQTLAAITPEEITGSEALATLPLLRKSDLLQQTGQPLQLAAILPIPVGEASHIFQSPGPIYEIGMRKPDWWRFGRALKAAGIGQGDIVQNCFSYHFTPAGMMFDSAASAVGAAIFPAGVGQTELQASAICQLGVTAYAGTPDFLKAILEKADALGLDSSTITKAVVSGGPLFPALRSYYDARGIYCRQCYGTADAGHIAYESQSTDGLILDEGVIVEIVRPGTGLPVAEGEIGEIVVTTLNDDFPMLRLATGDLSAFMPGLSACGRTNKRIIGWRGRADQATKIKGMFVRPEQVAQLVARHKEIARARITVTHDGSADQMHVQIETSHNHPEPYADSVRDILKLRAEIEIVSLGSLPNDGLVIDDQRALD